MKKSILMQDNYVEMHISKFSKNLDLILIWVKTTNAIFKHSRCTIIL